MGYHADFQREFDRDMVIAKKALFAKKANHKATASEWRELMVEVSGRVWYELISEETIAKSHLSAGWSNAEDGSQNHLAKAQLPSGKHLYPSYGPTGAHSLPAQSGFGVVVTGTGCEVVDDHLGAAPVARPHSQDTPIQLVLQHEVGDSELVFRTEAEQKLEDVATPRVRKKQKTEASLEQGIAGSDEESETSDDEEHHAFDEKHFLAEAKDRLGADFTLELSPPEILDSSLVGRCIAFHHGEPQPGWDCGEVKCQVDPSKHKEGYNYDVFYPDRGGTVFHRLQLELCGVGDEDGSPLGSWVLLAGAAKKKTAHHRKIYS